MCYTGVCIWENDKGECKKPYAGPCPIKDEEEKLVYINKQYKGDEDE